MLVAYNEANTSIQLHLIMSDVFISYSRRDIDFVRHLFDQLKARDREAWADWQDIPPTADWLAEIYSGIEAANTFLFVISPDSVASEICTLEIEHAVKHFPLHSNQISS